MERLKAVGQAKKWTAAMDKLSDDITMEARSWAPDAHFSSSLQTRLMKYPKEVRTDIVTCIKHKSAPLFHACAKGKLEMVEYLLSTCGANPEQKGWHEESEEMVPPLWCATVSRKSPVVKCLLSHGCQVDAVSDGQTTSLEAACFGERANLDIVKYLLQYGAKIDRAFHYGRTCLLEAVKNIKLCRILLKYGADVNITDMEGRTALHYAIELQKLDTLKLLLENKADPHMRTEQGDDALQAAVLYGNEETVLALTEHTSYPPERLANMYELWGSGLGLENKYEEAWIHWRKAIEIRNLNMVDGNPLAKKRPEENLGDDAMEKPVCYGNALEFTNIAELDALAGNWCAIRMQCMLILERILGTGHRILLSSIMEFAKSLYYNDNLRPISLLLQIHLWIRALKICRGDSELVARLLYDKEYLNTVCTIAEFIIKVNRGEQLRFTDVISIFRSLTSIFAKTWNLQKESLLKEKYRDEHSDCYRKMARYITHVVDWLIITARTNEDENKAQEYVRWLIEINPKSIPGNNTLLHSYVMDPEWDTVTDSESDSHQCVRVAKLLLRCGARVNARNAQGETLLHRACSRRNFCDPLNKLLVEHGAHLDTPDGRGSTPARIISAHPRNTIDVESHMTLRCHAARAIVKHEIRFPEYLPASVQEFIDLHRRKKEVE